MKKKESIHRKITMFENSKNEVEFREKVYFSDPNLAREARREKLPTQQKLNKKHCTEGCVAGLLGSAGLCLVSKAAPVPPAW